MGYIKRQEPDDPIGGEYSICIKESSFTGDVSVTTRDYAANSFSNSDRDICCIPQTVSLRGKIKTICRCASVFEYPDLVRGIRGPFGGSIPYRDTPPRGTITCPTTTQTISFTDTMIKGWCEEVPQSVLDATPGVPPQFIVECPLGQTEKDVNITINVPDAFTDLISRDTDNYGFDCPPYDNRDYLGCPCTHSTETIIRPDGSICYYCENTLERFICLMTELACDQFEGRSVAGELYDIVIKKLIQDGEWLADCE